MRLGGAAAPDTVSLIALAFTVLVPTTDKLNLYLSALVVESAGTETPWLTDPEVHGTVAGSPLMAGADEKTQDVALVTFADSDTRPPAEPRVLGVATKAVTVGAVGVLETSGVALAAWDPVAAPANAPGAESKPTTSASPHPTRMAALFRRFRPPSVIITPPHQWWLSQPPESGEVSHDGGRGRHGHYVAWRKRSILRGPSRCRSRTPPAA